MTGKTICIFGAGAIGSHLGARLALSGAAVTLVARGDHFAAMRNPGLRLVTAEGEVVAHPACTDDPAALPPQDFVILTVKTPALPAAAAAIQPLIGPDTVIVAAANGVPWWYFHRHPAPFTDHRLASVDPGGVLWERLPPQRVIGCVIYAAGAIVRPGVVKASGTEFRLGDPGGRLGDDMVALAAMLGGAGFNAPLCSDIRQEVWAKLWGNSAFNPLSVLTGAPLDRLAAEPASRDVARKMMSEARAVGERLGISFPIDVDRRIAQAQALGPHKTSMLQDLERRRPLETDALLGAVVEMAALVGVETPVCELVLGLVRQRASVAGCDPS